jgi:aryl-alcohol dehydrogenase-like predicted oxidoreductase
MLERRALGKTGMTVSALGLGAGPLGDAAISDGAAEAVVRRAVDLGVTVIDTAPSYGSSEERVGRALRGRRDGVVVVTKGGYGVDGVADWTPAIVEAGIAQALARMAIGWLDVFVLHSCDAVTLERMLPALVRAREAGMVRAVGYSGDGDALAWAVRCGALDVVECSVNVVDQAALGLEMGGLGVIGKRALANAAWTHRERPARHDTAIYWERAREMGLVGGDLCPAGSTAEGRCGVIDLTEDVAVRFAVNAPGVSCALVGTRQVAHLEAAVAAAARGRLPDSVEARLRAAWRSEWPGVV